MPKAINQANLNDLVTQKTRGQMTERNDDHRRLILDQFTKQVVPFSKMQGHSPELILAASGVEPEDNVLDVACGPGLMACAFAKAARHVTGIDLTPAMIEQARVLQQSISNRLSLISCTDRPT